MTSNANSPDEYVAELPEERVIAVQKLRDTIKKISQRVLKKP